MKKYGNPKIEFFAPIMCWFIKSIRSTRMDDVDLFLLFKNDTDMPICSLRTNTSTFPVYIMKKSDCIVAPDEVVQLKIGHATNTKDVPAKLELHFRHISGSGVKRINIDDVQNFDQVCASEAF